MAIVRSGKAYRSSDHHGLTELILSKKEWVRLRRFVREVRCLGRTLTCLAVISTGILTGCVTTTPPPVPTMEMREHLGTMAIVPAQYVPRTNFAVFAKSKPAGAAQGAAIGTGSGALVAIAATNPYTAIFVPFIMVLGGVTGAVEGGMRAMPAKNVQEIESTLNASVSKLDAQHALAVGVTDNVQKENWIRLRAVDAPGPAAAAESPAYASLRPAGIDTVLEIAVSEIGFDDSACAGLTDAAGHKYCRRTGNSLIFFMRAKARLVRVSDGTELFAREFGYQSPWREPAQWLADDGRLIAVELESAYRDLAGRINDEALLVTPIDLPAPAVFSMGGDPQSGVCWLAPVYPKIERLGPLELFSKSRDTCSRMLGYPIKSGTVDSQRPTLRWSSFPRDLDREKLDPELLRKINDVTYDLKIWEVERCGRGKLVYERNGLSAAEHQLEEPLKPAQDYFWSFRARFTVNGQPMATRWAFFSAFGCYPEDVAAWMYHRFVTPK